MRLTRLYRRRLRNIPMSIAFPGLKYGQNGPEGIYSIWKPWTTSIICPDLNFNDRTIQTVVDHCRMKITPLTTYINITHLSDRSVTWSSNITVDSFNSVKNRRTHKSTLTPCKTNSPNISSNEINPPSPQPSHITTPNPSRNSSQSSESSNTLISNNIKTSINIASHDIEKSTTD